ncbi:selenium metabolism-associated LysR family transcriptional regulator [Alkaliphilus hydrothermalis]|uniref:DNA-binding transcriptional LysR family regulator n=1 Tax=Alkaliphilus hydrothermalis TaxID=1482730 RepID=A0ABS2NPJ5_9FIRM|nr:selenium metabolism-associated LysR family transcriptional regulator [Alkaliphilus hydrothermalis]MBM7614832.1 DNA-binding transcriptional LysR family regulator [Alkaliphilus hydrothermalis]
MDFRQLETFVAVAKFKSFSKAADHLYLTQPTISSHISNLEKELNTILINRTNRKISLTKAGEILFDYAMNMVNLKEGAIFKLNEFKGKIVGNIEIAASTVPEQYIVPEIICGFNKNYPDVTFNMLHYDSQQVVEGIIHGDIDFGIVGAEIPHNQLNYVELLQDELFLITPASAPYCDFPEEVPLEKILEENLILREKGSGTRRLLEEALNASKIDLNNLKVVAYIESTEAIKQCIRRNLGISFLSSRAVVDEVNFNFFKTHRVQGLDLKRKFYFVYHKYRNPSPLEHAFQEFVCKYFKFK